MTDHLPECNQRDTAWQKAYYSGVECVCDALRACEQRVREDDNRALWDQRQFNAGLSAARDAVAALLDEFPNPDFQIANAAVHTALAAIDALRGESE